MALTTRTNGSSSPNIITSSWFNDFKDLLTGVMQDQEVTLKNNLVLSAIGAGPTVAPSGTLAAGTNLGIGAYKWAYTWVSPDGESLVTPQLSLTTTTGNQAVNLTAIAVGPTGTTARKVYRTAVGGSALKLLTTINDNSTTTFSDTLADGSLGAAAPTDFSFGGSLLLKNPASTVTAYIKNNGAGLLAWLYTLDPAPTVVTGGVSGTATVWQPFRGDVKVVFIWYNNFKTSTSAQNLPFPLPFTSGFLIFGSDFPGSSFFSGGSTQNVDVLTTLASGGGTKVNQATISSWSLGAFVHPADTLQAAANNASAHTGGVFLIGT
jgi:hypothetical protein